MNQLLGLVGLAFVVSITPGPNNAELALKLSGSVYLVYLAFRIATSRAGGRTVIPRPLGVLDAAAFQFTNLKAWLFALAAVGTFLPPNLAPVVAGLAVAATCAVVVLATAAAWAAGGAALNHVVDDGRAQRVVNLTLALLLAASVAFIWI
jgi:threonine/homoserine/homoserine lactone efflux protein